MEDEVNKKEKISGIKAIRISLFGLLMILFWIGLIIKYIENVKSREILAAFVFVLDAILIGFLTKSRKLRIHRIMVLDIVIMVMIIGVFAAAFAQLSKITTLTAAFSGNNLITAAYSRGIGDAGYEDLEAAIAAEMENNIQTTNQGEMEEIYRIKMGDRSFIYVKTPGSVIELEFFCQDHVYYSSGDRALTYYSQQETSEEYTTEETIRADIANTMYRGAYYEEVGAPIWGISDDERICFMTLNSEKPDDVMKLENRNGKTYYFWVMARFDDVQTMDDVKKIQIQFDDYYNR